MFAMKYLSRMDYQTAKTFYEWFPIKISLELLTAYLNGKQ